MVSFKHRFNIYSDLQKVWAFYTQVEHLDLISPKELNLRVKNATDRTFSQGTELWVQGKILFYTIEWHSIISSIMEYEYVDEMLSGPLKSWKHLHKFSYDEKLKQTEVIDEIEFELPYGVIGSLFEAIAIRKLKTIFAHRKRATIKAVESG